MTRTLFHPVHRTVARVVLLLCALLHSAVATVAVDTPGKSESESADPSRETVTGPPPTRIVRLVRGKAVRRQYPYALTSLLAELNKRTTLNVDEQPLLISSFDDPALLKHPFLFVNFADRTDWTLSSSEVEALRNYLDRGGFMFIDAGINTEFLRGKVSHGQHHSYADWEVSPVVREVFKGVYPEKSFRPLPRSHELFRSFHRGLPDPSSLPDSVRDFVVNEKWPDGTYSAVGLFVDNRIAVLCMPIISMGWGKDPFGNWATRIKFRIRESAEGLSERLRTAAYSGARYEAVREDGRKDVIYCQKEALPAWVQEPDGRWRVFRYYQSREISEYAHVFYTRLGINIVVHALTR